MRIEFEKPVLLVASQEVYMVVDPGSIWESKNELFSEFPVDTDIIEVVPLADVGSYAEHLERINDLIEVIQESGVETIENTYSIPRQVH